jgi:hypothetical protein
LVFLTSALGAAACGHKSIKMPIAVASAPLPPISSHVESGSGATANSPAPANRAPARAQARDSSAAAPQATGLLGSEARRSPGPVGTSSVVITQSPNAPTIVSGSNAAVSGGERGGRGWGDGRRILVASLVAVGLIAAVLGVPRLTDS